MDRERAEERVRQGMEQLRGASDAALDVCRRRGDAARREARLLTALAALVVIGGVAALWWMYTL